MRFAGPVRRAALASGLSGWLAGRRPQRRVLMLHGVGDEHMPTADFEAGLAWLARHFQVVSLGSLVDGLQSGRAPAPGGELAITFDDGLRNQLEQAYPVLERLRLPATFFVCPGLMDTGRWIWNQEMRCRLRTLAAADRTAFAAASGPPTADIEALVARMKTLPLAERTRQEEALRERTAGFVPSQAERRACDPLAWDDLARLDPALVTIGSHTLTHPILTSLDEAGLAHEIDESRRVLEARLGRPVDLFCYPNGSMDPRVRAVVARRYRAAVTTEYGFVTPGSALERLPRIAGSPSLATLAWRMHRPAS